MRSPHIFTRKSRLQPGEFLITSAKRLLQQYLPIDDVRKIFEITGELLRVSSTSVGFATPNEGLVCSGVVSWGCQLRRGF